MNEDFVTFELSVKLNEKGFREKCIATYDIEDKEFDFNNYILRVAYQMNVTAKDCLRVFNDSNCGLIDAPTISQVLKWLRNTYNLHVETYPCGLGMWKFLVTNITTLEERALCDKHTSSEQAALAGIEYVLDNLI